MPENIYEYLPLIIPLAALQLGLMAAAVIHILTHSSYRYGGRGLWLAVSVLFSVVGPALYFVVGRSEGESDGGGL
uniref:Cardiolipin synthase N-terminal domain-containing protein n=1 Tax=uncultured bacterium contig00006 TaxID=1181498 RepID=A0A806JYJ6_9BACT|nr:hypothetical protein [uncultured bacterium contig00006]